MTTDLLDSLLQRPDFHAYPVLGTYFLRFNVTRPPFIDARVRQPFALAVRLSEEGCFTWHEWAETLGAQFKAAAARGEPDDGSHYYEHWLAALEKLVTAKGLSDAAALLALKEEWAAAYRATPHGQPVELAAGRR